MKKNIVILISMFLLSIGTMDGQASIGIYQKERMIDSDYLHSFVLVMDNSNDRILEYKYRIYPINSIYIPKVGYENDRIDITLGDSEEEAMQSLYYLLDFIEENEDRGCSNIEFEYGGYDCVLFDDGVVWINENYPILKEDIRWALRSLKNI